LHSKGQAGIELVIMVALIVNLTGIVIATHRSFKEKMSRMKCDSNMTNIMEAIQIYHAYYNLEKEVIREEKVGEVNLEFLLSKKFLLHYPQCPEGGVYKWDSDGELYCTYHGAGEIK
jgi:Tfp pilus assembly protein PilE